MSFPCVSRLLKAPPGEPTLKEKNDSGGRKWHLTLTSYSTRTRHSLLESVTLSLPGGYVHLCTHFPAHPSLPQHAPSCASFLSRAAQRRPGPVSSLGINWRSASAFQSRVKKKKVNYNCRAREKWKGNLRWHLSALVAYEMAGNEFEYGRKARQCVVFVLPVESALKGVKREGPGAHPGSRRTRPVGTPGPIITGPRTSACPGISRSGQPLCPVASANQSCQ